MTGKNIILRALEPSDVEILYRWENDHRLWHLSNTSGPFSRYVLGQYLRNAHQDIFTAKQLRLMIDTGTEASNARTVGAVDLFDFDPSNRRAGLGILIVDEEQNKGFGTEAVKLMVEYCFGTLNLHQVYCNILPDNTTSIRLFEKQGFTVCGRKREWILINNRWHDELMLQLVNPKKAQ